MVNIGYDSGLVLASAIMAFLLSYIALSVEQFLFQKLYKKYEKIILILSGMILGLAIWAMHFLGILAYPFPQDFQVDRSLLLLSYVVACFASTFTLWLTTRPTLPLARLVIGAMLMGLGISGTHYIGVMAVILPDYHLHYDTLLVVFSVLIAMSGSGLSFWLAFKHKIAYVSDPLHPKLGITLMMVLTILAMHHIGMAAAHFHQEFVEMAPSLNHDQAGQGALLLTVIFISSLILMVAFAVSVLEQRLEERNHQLLAANRELASLALQDNLTKLPNRLFLVDYAQRLLHEHRYLNLKMAWLYIDLDRFKVVNDTFGHHVGDQLLIQLTNRLHAHLADQQKLLRVGGDEFLLVIEKTSTEKAMQIAEQLLQQIQSGFWIAGKEINISASIGIAMYPEHGNNLQDLLINADAAMLMSKEQGRNTYSVFSYSLDQQHSQNQSKLINDLYKAVEEQQFVLFYQPKFTTDYQICGVEALIRWKHPTLGLLTPNMFIQGAEKTGLILRMGYWALEQACKQIQRWEQSGEPFFPIAVNLSAIQFEHKHLLTTLQRLLGQYQIRPEHLIIEITESTAMHHIELNVRTFEHLRAMGIRIAIDDFGTGHSSFLYLKKLPVDELKIDRGFIRDLTPGSKDEMILESIIQLAIKLGLTVTAEGVETPLQAEILTRLGCQQLQGFLLGMPVDADRLAIFTAEFQPNTPLHAQRV